MSRSTSRLPPPPPSAHTVNTDSTSNFKTQASSGARVRVGRLNLQAKQALALPSGLRHELQFYPASSTPSFGSYFTIDIKAQNILLHNVTLQFNLGNVVGTSVVGSFSPAYFFFNRIEIVQGTNVIKTIQGNQQFLKNNLFEWDEDRMGAIMTACGRYDSATQRATLSSTTTPNTFYVNLKTYFDTISVPMLTDAHQIQLRVYMEPLASVYAVTSGTLTSCAINSVNAICKVTRLDNATSNLRLQQMAVAPFHNIFMDNVYFPYTIPAGVSTVTTVLSGITGNVSALLFTIRASTTGTGAWNYTQLKDFSISDNTGTNIVGGQAIPATYASLLLNKDWIRSSYNTETSYGTNDQKANFYLYSFSSDLVTAVTQGQCLNSRRFNGAETLQLNFASALGANVSVDVYAFVESVLEQTPSSVRKITL